MRLGLFLLIGILLSGCTSIDRALRDIDNDAAEVLGTYSAPTLAGSPRPSGCTEQRCRTLDSIEAKGYELARQKKISWGKFVDYFYLKRSELYPNSNDSSGVYELRAYQKALAEQMDQGKLSESQWEYLVERKNSEIQARNKSQQTPRQRETNCTTINVGTKSFPNYQTTCN